MAIGRVIDQDAGAVCDSGSIASTARAPVFVAGGASTFTEDFADYSWARVLLIISGIFLTLSWPIAIWYNALHRCIVVIRVIRHSSRPESCGATLRYAVMGKGGGIWSSAEYVPTVRNSAPTGPAHTRLIHFAAVDTCTAVASFASPGVGFATGGLVIIKFARIDARRTGSAGASVAGAVLGNEGGARAAWCAEGAVGAVRGGAARVKAVVVSHPWRRCAIGRRGEVAAAAAAPGEHIGRAAAAGAVGFAAGA